MDLKGIGGEEVDWIHIYKQVEGCCDNGNELSGFTKCGGFLGPLEELFFFLFKKYCVLWS